MKNLIFFLLITICFVASATAQSIVDNAELLTDSEEALLEERAAAVRESYDYDVAILTINSLDGEDILSYANDYYDYNGYGVGSGYDGMIFVISMAERDFGTSTCGSGIYYFSDYTLDNIHENIVALLSAGKYFDAFSEYINRVEYVLYSAAIEKQTNSADAVVPEYNLSDSYNSNLYTYEDVEVSTAEVYIVAEIGIIIIALIIGLITVTVIKSPMKNIGIKKDADIYTGANDLKLKRQIDRFIYSNVSKTRIETNNSSGSRSSFGGGHSSTSFGSSGRVHGGRSGKF